jgi:hypothetical protein
MAHGFNGVADIVVIADLVARGEMLRRKVTHTLLPRLGALGPWPVRAIIGGVATIPPAYGVCASERSPLGVAIIWDGWESTARR